MSRRRERVCEIAEAWRDITADDAAGRELLDWICGPVAGGWQVALSVPFSCKLVDGKWVTRGVSTCGLVANGIWREAGCAWPRLRQSYLPGTAISGTVGDAMRDGSWRQPRQGRPQAGDYVVIGDGLLTHALVCTGWEGDTMRSVDGGQLSPKGLQAIYGREREWELVSGVPYVRGKSLGRVQGWVDCEAASWGEEPQPWR